MRAFARFEATLTAALARPLPAGAAHELLAPQPRRPWPPDSSPATARDAAGLLLVFPIDDRAHLVLTVRADTLGRHGGQVSLPGGVVEPGEPFEDAALREAHEEIALDRTQVRIVGRLTALEIPVSGFRLHPIVGVADRRPVLRPAAGEVAEILEVPLDNLMSPATLGLVERRRGGLVVAAPAFLHGGHEVWGATAMVLAEFLTLLGWRPR